VKPDPEETEFVDANEDIEANYEERNPPRVDLECRIEPVQPEPTVRWELGIKRAERNDLLQ